jgi:hypothetical protein
LLWITGVSLHAKSPVSRVEASPRTIVAKAEKGTPHEINYQGWLGDATDTVGVTSNLAMTFRLYGAETVGTELWSEAHISVPVDKGIFNVILGSVNPILSNVFTGAPLWLETQVATDTLSPRKKLVSVGYAIRSVYSDTAGYAGSSAPDNDWTVSGSNIYAQDTSWNVGIGTASPPTHSRLYVAANGAFYGVYGLGSDGKEAGVFGLANQANYGVLGLGSTGRTAGVSGEANGANYGVYGLGSTGRVAGVYGFANNANYGVYGRGSAGKTAGVYSVANGANYAGYFNGDVHITGAVTIDTVVRYYSIPGCEFGARYSIQHWQRSVSLYSNIASHWCAGIHLPDGAVITEVNVYVRDSDAQDIDFTLFRFTHTGGGASIMASGVSSGASGNQTITDDSIDYATIDNENHYYTVETLLRSENSDHRVHQVRIKYEITQPLP